MDTKGSLKINPCFDGNLYENFYYEYCDNDYSDKKHQQFIVKNSEILCTSTFGHFPNNELQIIITNLSKKGHYCTGTFIFSMSTTYSDLDDTITFYYKVENDILVRYELKDV